MSPLETVLDIKGLSVGLASDPEQRILDDISFELTAGKVIGLIGEAGSGKTVLARAIVRLALSYVSMPPEADHDVAADLARLMTPFAERHGATEPA